jgi:hypothetical protein
MCENITEYVFQHPAQPQTNAPEHFGKQDKSGGLLTGRRQMCSANNSVPNLTDTHFLTETY